jgi:hypothetical protein
MARNQFRRLALAVLLALAPSAFAYGPVGHQIVGAIADQRLANSATGAKVAALLDGLPLEKAAVIPDEIKGWDKRGADDPGIFHYSSHPKIDEQLRAFWRANQPTHDVNSPMPSHHWFHYTDVPVLNPEKYADGKTGRSQWDVVHMTRFCVAVLKGDEPEENARKITKPIAVILLAHYLGDIHQPLHVGAEYFDAAGRPIDPDKGKPGLEDEGGNTLTLQLTDGANPVDPRRHTKLHGFWDTDAVLANLPSFPETMPKEERREKTAAATKTLVDRLAKEEPKGWRMPAGLDVKDYAEAWANEILPLAREAHERLRFDNVRPTQQEDRTIAAGFADEKPSPDKVSYRDWSARVVLGELHKAGWRLADLLEQTLAAKTDPVATVAPSAGPASPSPNALYGEYPKDYKEIVTEWLYTRLFDPVHAKVEWQTEPQPSEMTGTDGKKLYGYLVNFTINAKNQFGSYTGAQKHGALIHDREVIKATGFGY